MDKPLGQQSPPALELKDVTIRINGATILKDIYWQVAPGEHWVVLGPNGSGKTTLLNVINGYLWPYGGRGQVSVLGHQLGACDLPAVRGQIGWVSSALQQRLHKHFTGLEIVLTGKEANMGLWRHAAQNITDDDYQLAREMLRRLDAEHLAARKYGNLSQGEQQRISLARALMAQPKLLLLDEPCTGLDFVAREQYLAMVEQTLQSNDSPTVIYITHHAEEILPSFKKVLLLAGGQAAAQGKKEKVLNESLLSQVFGLPLVVDWHERRPTIRQAAGSL